MIERAYERRIIDMLPGKDIRGLEQRGIKKKHCCIISLIHQRQRQLFVFLFLVT